jgi:signal transduction histidine kinase
VISRVKDVLKRHWPALRLRTILLAVLLFAAAMPAIGAVGLRVYENGLVRQTEAELVIQGAALTAAAEAVWPGGQIAPAAAEPPDVYQPYRSAIDLSATPVLPERPRPAPARRPAAPDAVQAAALMDPVFRQTTQSTLAAFVLLDRYGRVVRGLGLGGDLSGLPEVRAALHGQERTVLRRNSDYHPRHSMEWLSRASALRLHYARPITARGKVVGVLLVSRSPRALFRSVYDDRWKLLGGAGVIVLMLIILSGLVSRGVTRPIVALSRATHAVASGRGQVPAPPSTAAIEIRALYVDFRTMADAIARRSRYLRDFAAAVSHEFKTPLAGITGAVELLQDHYATMKPAERDRFLGNIAKDSNRLSQLVARLLDLARADMERPDADASTDPAACVRVAVDAPSGAVVDTALPDRLPPVSVPAGAVEAVLTTLMENSRQAGARRLVVSARVLANAVELTVADDGPGVAPADRERLFEPFFTTRRADGGTGLGLAIARSLMQAHGGDVAIAPAAAGAAFVVTLPQARPAD